MRRPLESFVRLARQAYKKLTHGCADVEPEAELLGATVCPEGHGRDE